MQRPTARDSDGSELSLAPRTPSLPPSALRPPAHTRHERGAHCGGAAAQIIVVPLRANVNLKSVTVEELVERRKVSAAEGIRDGL